MNQPEQESTRRTSNFHIIYKDGDIKGNLNKGDAQRILEADDGSGEINTVIKGYEVPFTIEKRPMATIDG